MPASMSIVRAPSARAAAASPAGCDCASSGGVRCSHSGFGTTPNIAPPSRRKKPSRERDQLEARRARDADRSSSVCSCRRGCFSSTSTPCAPDGWMNATSAPSAPGPRLLVDQPHAARLELRQRRVDVVDAQRDVMQARAALLDELRDRRVGRRRLEQFERRLADRRRNARARAATRPLPAPRRRGRARREERERGAAVRAPRCRRDRATLSVDAGRRRRRQRAPSTDVRGGVRIDLARGDRDRAAARTRPAPARAARRAP